MQEIRGEAKTIRQPLSGTRYAVDYYQREYKWQQKQVAELIEDLAAKFLESLVRHTERLTAHPFPLPEVQAALSFTD